MLRLPGWTFQVVEQLHYVDEASDEPEAKAPQVLDLREALKASLAKGKTTRAASSDEAEDEAEAPANETKSRKRKAS